MKVVYEHEGRAASRACWWQRVARLIVTVAVVIAVAPMSLAQPVEIAYNKTIAFSKESFVRGAQVIKDQFLKMQIDTRG